MGPPAGDYNAAGIALPMHPLPPVAPLANLEAIDPQTLTEVVRRVFGQHLRPLDRPSYQRPYPDWDGRSSVEHISHFTAQCSKAGYNGWHKLQLFSLSLTGAAFSWYSALPPNFVKSWQNLERTFHDRFYSPPAEVTLLNLMSSRRKIDESLAEYIECFRQLKSRCNIQILDAQATNIAEFSDFQQLVVHVVEQMIKERQAARVIRTRPANQSVLIIDEKTADESAMEEDEQPELCAAELVQGKMHTCPTLRLAKGKEVSPKVTYSFDISKVDQIFDFLLKVKQIKLKDG
ncbi:uncharacterized protein LOC127254393 [Andrographis paniculata]|uniref:uncharacterized protein LOC127254393 n=1 Tax=Andrographis paniculata TaxID=175694 RepID=UPI0021E7C8E2|nr:uncharacterized protein LOC127254393 [Andrographis paniculata]